MDEQLLSLKVMNGKVTKDRNTSSQRSTLKVGTVEWWNGGVAEWRKMTPNPKTRNGGK